jgi:hypothetical protein
MGEHRNAGGGVTLLLAEKAEKVHQFTCYWRTIHVMLGLQSRDHAKKRKENTGKRLEGNIIVDDTTLYWFKKKIIIIVILMLTNITINRSYSIGSTSQLRSIICMDTTTSPEMIAMMIDIIILKLAKGRTRLSKSHSTL